MEKGTREMNANELADELEKRHLLGGYASEAATMLRQQQKRLTKYELRHIVQRDRIAILEAQLVIKEKKDATTN